jgi:hypothetical protein
MKKVEEHIDDIVKRVLSEEISLKAEEIMSMAKEGSFGDGRDRIDVAKPKGKITPADFKKLQSMKKHKEMKEVDMQWVADEVLSKDEPLYRGTKFVKEEDLEEYSFGDTATDDDLGYNDMLPSADYEDEIKKPHKVTNVGDKYQRKVSKEFNEIGYTDINDYDDIQGGYYNPNIDKYDRLSKKYPGVVISHGDYDKSDEELDTEYTKIMGKEEPKGETEEGNEFSGARAEAIKKGEKSFEVNGKPYPVKESIQLSEEELIDLIEKIVNEQTEVKVTNKSLKDSGKENEDHIKSVTKKMQTYLKDASKGKYETNPDQFPKGNGELAKMSKKAYTPSKAVEEYIENIAQGGAMENIQYDEIKPNEEWLEKNIEGSSMTGNAAGGNAIDTGLGKKINTKRKKNLYGKEKQKSYNRYTQPVDEAGEGAGEDSLDKMFSKLGESNEKKTKLITEDMEKIKHLLNYSKKTQ